MARKCIFCNGSVSGGDYLIEDCDEWFCPRCGKEHMDMISEFREMMTEMVNAEDESEAGEFAEHLEVMLDDKTFTKDAADSLQRFIGMKMDELFDSFDREEMERKIARRHAVRASERARAVKQEKERSQYLASHNAQYEYMVDCIYDQSGVPNIPAIQQSLSDHAKEGWRLHTAVSNELGKNAFSLGLSGFSSGTNATVEATILIYERCIRPERWNTEE